MKKLEYLEDVDYFIDYNYGDNEDFSIFSPQKVKDDLGKTQELYEQLHDIGDFLSRSNFKSSYRRFFEIIEMSEKFTTCCDEEEFEKLDDFEVYKYLKFDDYVIKNFCDTEFLCHKDCKDTYSYGQNYCLNCIWGNGEKFFDFDKAYKENIEAYFLVIGMIVSDFKEPQFAIGHYFAMKYFELKKG